MDRGPWSFLNALTCIARTREFFGSGCGDLEIHLLIFHRNRQRENPRHPGESVMKVISVARDSSRFREKKSLPIISFHQREVFSRVNRACSC